MKTSSILASALLLSGCASTWQLALMPRDSGKIYYGTAEDVGAGEGPIAITIENRAYRGTWVQSVPDHAHSYVGGGAVYPYGRRGGWGYGGTWIVDNPLGGETKALLTSPDGAGLRCDFRGSQGFGGGLCRDDAGKEYDVQIRQGPPPPAPK
jgi:hypothetical protein